MDGQSEISVEIKLKTMSTTCSTVGCSNPAKMQCPKCLGLGITAGSHFCSQVGRLCIPWPLLHALIALIRGMQDCFKASWNTHKLLHKTASPEGAALSTGATPVPGYGYTGTMRPWPQVRPLF